MKNLVLSLHLWIVLLFVSASAAAAPTAVILVDMQTKLLRNQWHMKVAAREIIEQSDRLVAEQMRLLEWAKAKGYPVLVFELHDSGPTISPLKEMVESFGEGRFAFVTKYSNSGFQRFEGRPPAEILRGWGVRHAIVSGINGNACVSETVQGALENEFEVLSSSDLTANFNYVCPVYPDERWWREEKALQGNAKFHGFRFREEAQECASLLEAS